MTAGRLPPAAGRPDGGAGSGVRLPRPVRPGRAGCPGRSRAGPARPAYPPVWPPARPLVCPQACPLACHPAGRLPGPTGAAPLARAGARPAGRRGGRRLPWAAGVLLLLAAPAGAQEISISLGEDGALTGVTLQLLLAITLLSLVPGLAVMVTCFPFIVTVLSILRMAIGLQQSPPNMLIVTLALFLTYFVMDPVLAEAWATGVRPLLDEEIDLTTGFTRTLEPFRVFMAARVDPQTFATLQGLRPDSVVADGTPGSAPLSVLVPSFLLSEIERAFEIGFLIFMPFLIIDLVVAAVLMSMGMMMVPPALVSLPFKLAFFVVADGWSLISEALVRGYL